MPLTAISLDALVGDLAQIEALSPETAKALWLEVVALEKALAMRALTASAPPPEERLLDITEAAVILSKTIDWLYRHAKTLPFVVREGRLLRFSHSGIQKYIRARTR